MEPEARGVRGRNAARQRALTAAIVAGDGAIGASASWVLPRSELHQRHEASRLKPLPQARSQTNQFARSAFAARQKPPHPSDETVGVREHIRSSRANAAVA